MKLSAEKTQPEVPYRDRKRYLWILSVLSPMVPGMAALCLFTTGNMWWAAVPIVFYYIAIPVLDSLIGSDFTNPPEEVIGQMERDVYYRALLWLASAALYINFFVVTFVVGTIEMPIWAMLMLAVSAGVASGSGLTVGHELGHKQNRADQFLAKLVNSLTGYAHFCIEHNRGHHTLVATPEDHASSRLGESVWAFALREIPGVARHGWEMEKARLEKKGFSTWSLKNDLLQGYAITLVIAVFLIAAYGVIMVPFLIIHHVVGWLQLTFANYVEHYGLLREKKDNGRYQVTEPHHSWNTNHIVSNLMLFHLQRHSDHHANPQRPYQALRNFEELPTLPSGYPGSFVLASIPPLWFKIMDPKVKAWAKGNLSKTNILPAKRDHYLKDQAVAA